MEPDDLLGELRDAEQAWLDASARHDRRAMAVILGDGFTATLPDGSVLTREGMIAGLNRLPLREVKTPVPFTQKRSIRMFDSMAILHGIYVVPGGEGRPERRSRYTDTWVRSRNRCRIVASHRSNATG
ncbi:nuclear transport factor 2 family protein [Rubricoccus marinus]|nr:nuclear transport factor 2 family protein [Rubricoccus marinus]